MPSILAEIEIQQTLEKQRAEAASRAEQLRKAEEEEKNRLAQQAAKEKEEAAAREMYMSMKEAKLAAEREVWERGYELLEIYIYMKRWELWMWQKIDVCMGKGGE